MHITVSEGAARRAGICAGDTLISIDGNKIKDVLDYNFYTYNKRLNLQIKDKNNTEKNIRIVHNEGEDIGLSFETFLMDKERSCKNKCVFCFIDQNPPGCRETMYYKDDDARLSFLLGNYITLTNVSDDELSRLCKMRISPLGVSVHTTNADLRVRMLKNPRAAEIMPMLRKLRGADITINAQVVLCPSYNDGTQLFNTLRDLYELGTNSVSVVPVGITKYRQNLPSLLPVTKEIALETIELAKKFPNVYCSDEMYLRAEIPLPDYEYYKDFPQLENGVGMLKLLEEEWDYLPKLGKVKKQSIATGYAAAPFLQKLLKDTNVNVYAIKNDFFGETVDVAGLISGGDIIRELAGKDLGERLIIPKVMLKHGTNLFLDDKTTDDISSEFGVPVLVANPDAEGLYNALMQD